MSQVKFPVPDGCSAIFRPYKTLPDGTVRWAKQDGKRAYVFIVKDDAR